MKKTFIVACLMLFMATAISAQAAKPKAGVINTLHTDGYKEMFSKGNTLKCPVVIDISAEWCGWCTKLHPNIVEVAKKYSGEIYFFQLNYETDLDLIRELGVTGYPSLIYITSDGKAVMESGYRTVEQLEANFMEKFSVTGEKNEKKTGRGRIAIHATQEVASWPTESWPGTELASWPTESWPGTELASWPTESWPGTKVASRPTDSWPGTDLASWPTESWPGTELASWPTESWPGTELASWPTESWPGTEVASWPTESWPGTGVASWPTESWPGTELASWPNTEVASWPTESWPTESWPLV